MERSEFERVLADCELFKGLGKSDIGEIAGLCHLETYGAGEKVFSQGDFGEIGGPGHPQGQCGNRNAG